MKRIVRHRQIQRGKTQPRASHWMLDESDKGKAKVEYHNYYNTQNGKSKHTKGESRQDK